MRTWRVDYTTPDYQPPTPLDQQPDHDQEPTR